MKKFKVSVHTNQYEEFVLIFSHGDDILYKTYLTREEAQNLNSDLEKHLHDLWIEQHGMD